MINNGLPALLTGIAAGAIGVLFWLLMFLLICQ
jgi:hypothetical protein